MRAFRPDNSLQTGYGGLFVVEMGLGQNAHNPYLGVVAVCVKYIIPHFLQTIPDPPVRRGPGAPKGNRNASSTVGGRPR